MPAARHRNFKHTASETLRMGALVAGLLQLRIVNRSQRVVQLHDRTACNMDVKYLYTCLLSYDFRGNAARAPQAALRIDSFLQCGLDALQIPWRRPILSWKRSYAHGGISYDW